MKRILCILLCFVALISFTSCKTYKEQSNLPPVENESVTDIPTDIEDEEITIPEDEEEEEKKKKLYIRSTVNGLRVRSGSSNNSTILGSLDKNDMLAFTETVGNYYKTTFKEKVAYVYAPYCELEEFECVDDKAEKAVDFGTTLLGYPYVWGSQRYHWGNGKLNSNFVNGEFDCSAFVQYIYYQSNGALLDVTTRKQVNNGATVEKADLKRGDLMFFTNESRKNKTGVERIGHVGIYLGENYILHTSSDHAVIEPISSTRWSYYITARRVV